MAKGERSGALDFGLKSRAMDKTAPVQSGGGTGLSQVGDIVPIDRSKNNNGVKSQYGYDNSPAVVDNTRGASEYWNDRATNAISNGLGATNTYEDKAGNFISQNPYTAPDYYRNWVNDGRPLDFANRHGTETTNYWARMGDSFNNMRHWDPGQEATAGPAGAGVTQTGQYGQSKRWEPIDTQELRAQQRAEDREADVMGKGIARQDIYARYPYDMSVAHQTHQMDADYGLDQYRGKTYTDYQMLIRKANDASNATGIYAIALWGLTGIGGYQLNPYDREAYNQMAAIMNNPGMTVEAKRKACEQVLAGVTKYKLDATGMSINQVLELMKDKVGSAAMPDITTLMWGVSNGIWNQGSHQQW